MNTTISYVFIYKLDFCGLRMPHALQKYESGVKFQLVFPRYNKAINCMRVVAFKQTRVFVLFWLCVSLKFQLCSLKILPFFCAEQSKMAAVIDALTIVKCQTNYRFFSFNYHY